MTPYERQDRSLWLQGPSSPCRVMCEATQPWRLVVLGPPGVGKGTQADLLNRRLHACHLSTGDVFRAAGNMAEPSQAMKEALACMRRGELVSDAVVWDIVSERAQCLKCAGGFILDGFPRTLGQAIALHSLTQDQGLPLHAVLNYTLPVSDIVRRLGGRRTCEVCKTIYNVADKPPKVEGRCDRCNGNLFQRDDDRPESIEVRLEAYHRNTAPLIEYYEKLKLLVTVDASGPAEDIFSRTVLSLGSFRHAELARQIWVLGQE